MQSDEYKKIFLSEDSYWWYKGVHVNLLNLLKTYFPSTSNLKILDAGCGTGRILQLLQDYGDVFGIDISSEAIKYARMRNIAKLIQGDVLYLPFNNNTFDCIVAFDLLYSIDKDSIAIREFHRIMKKSALLMFNLPAYNFLYSQHDRAISTKHRYSKRSFERRLIKSRFKIEKITYWNTFLFPIVAFSRVIKKFTPNKNPKSDLVDLPHYVNNVLTKIVYVETLLIKRLNLPFGLSLLVVARKY